MGDDYGKAFTALFNWNQTRDSKIDAAIPNAPGTVGPAPTVIPDLTDGLVRRRRAAAAFAALSGRGRASTMPGVGPSTASPTVGSAGLGSTLLGGA